MKPKYMAALAISCAIAAQGHAAPNDSTDDTNTNADSARQQYAIETIEVTAERLNDKRAGIRTQTGASTYTIDEAAIDATPGRRQYAAEPGHPASPRRGAGLVRAVPRPRRSQRPAVPTKRDHPARRHQRLRSVAEPASDLGIATDHRCVTCAIRSAHRRHHRHHDQERSDRSRRFDLGVRRQPRYVQPSIVYGGSSDNLNYFVTGDYVRSNMGIESPDRSTDPLHDDTTQYHGFGYFEDILDPDNRLSLIVGTSNGKFQIPNKSGLATLVGIDGARQSEFPSEALDETQRRNDELRHRQLATFAGGARLADVAQHALFSARVQSPSPLGDLLYNGIAQKHTRKTTRSAGRPTVPIG